MWTNKASVDQQNHQDADRIRDQKLCCENMHHSRRQVPEVGNRSDGPIYVSSAMDFYPY
ncbi:MAG: hypothetical protein GKR97_08765 [Rhizobiaceae bacterium]|nr:hypothetical protein [Rhizobiaceae bacterium]